MVEKSFGPVTCPVWKQVTDGVSGGGSTSETKAGRGQPLVRIWTGGGGHGVPEEPDPFVAGRPGRGHVRIEQGQQLVGPAAI